MLIAKAIQERDSKLQKDSMVSDKDILGSWSVIIDTIRNTKIKRQEIAVKNISAIMSFNGDSTPQNLIRFLKDLHVSGQIDTTFKDILENSYQECVKNNHEDSASVYKFAMDVVERLGPAETTKPTSSSLSSITPLSSSNTTTTNKLTSLNTTNIGSRSSATNEINANSVSPHNELSMEWLESSGRLLAKLMIECRGNAPLLKEKVLFLLKHHQYNTTTTSATTGINTNIDSDHDVIHVEAFLTVLNDNIEASKLAGYANKVALYGYVKDTVVKFQLDSTTAATTTAIATATNTDDTVTAVTKKRSNGTADDDVDEDVSTVLSSHHAPQFVDSVNKKNKLSNSNGSSNSGDTAVESYVQVLSPLSFINGSNLMNNLLHTNIKNMKKKSEKKYEKQKAEAVLQKIGSSLDQSGYAVLDNFLPVELIKRVRIESGLFINQYEQSEIWVGKEADVGAHIQVPSVRGDKVLWMCGGHDKKVSAYVVSTSIVS